MRLDITAHDPSQRPNQIINLSRIRTPDGIGNADTVDTDLVDGAVDGEEVDELGAEGVFGGEPDLYVFGFDELDDFNGAMGDASQQRRSF